MLPRVELGAANMIVSYSQWRSRGPGRGRRGTPGAINAVYNPKLRPGKQSLLLPSPSVVI